MLVRLFLTRVVPYAATIRWQKLSRKRHDFVMVADEKAGAITLRLSGDAIASETRRAACCFREVLARGKTIELDLSSTTIVDSRFLGLLLMLRKYVKDSGKALRFVNLPASLQRQFRLAGAEYLLPPSKQ
jgi:N-acetylglucosaminyldiphosphoundecaprenol N-acetyl-beta-D-mannosaminyltransferase